MRSINRRVRGRSYLSSFRNSALALSNIREELHRRDCGKLGALTWRRVIQVDHRVGSLLRFGVGEDEFLYRPVGCLRTIEDTSDVIPWGEVVRCKRYLPLSVPGVRFSVRKPVCQGEHKRNLAPHHFLPVFISLPDSRIKHDKEPVVPSGVVPDILIYQLLYERDLHRPKFVSIKVRKDPLAIGPSVIVLGIFLEYILDKFQLLEKQVGGFGCRIFGVDVCQEETAMVPDLVVLEEGRRDLVHEQQLKIKRRVYGNKGLVPILPAQRLDSVTFL